MQAVIAHGALLQTVTQRSMKPSWTHLVAIRGKKGHRLCGMKGLQEAGIDLSLPNLTLAIPLYWGHEGAFCGRGRFARPPPSMKTRPKTSKLILAKPAAGERLDAPPIGLEYLPKRERARQ